MLCVLPPHKPLSWSPKRRSLQLPRNVGENHACSMFAVKKTTHARFQGAIDETQRVRRGGGRQEDSLAAHDQPRESGPCDSGALQRGHGGRLGGEGRFRLDFASAAVLVCHALNGGGVGGAWNGGRPLCGVIFVSHGWASAILSKDKHPCSDSIEIATAAEEHV